MTLAQQDKSRIVIKNMSLKISEEAITRDVKTYYNVDIKNFT